MQSERPRDITTTLSDLYPEIGNHRLIQDVVVRNPDAFAFHISEVDQKAGKIADHTWYLNCALAMPSYRARKEQDVLMKCGYFIVGEDLDQPADCIRAALRAMATVRMRSPNDAAWSNESHAQLIRSIDPAIRAAVVSVYTSGDELQITDVATFTLGQGKALILQDLSTIY